MGWKTKDDEVKIFPPEEMTPVLAYAPANLIPFLTIGAFAGLPGGWNAHVARCLRSIWNVLAANGSRSSVPARIVPNLGTTERIDWNAGIFR